MKKFFYSFLFVLLAFTTNLAYCSAQDNTVFSAFKKPTVAVVFVGASEFQTPTFYNLALEQLAKKFDPDLYTLSAAIELQKSSQKYWSAKGIAPAQVSNDDFLSFSQTISYDYVLLLILNQPSVETQKTGVQLEQTTAVLEAKSIYINNKQQTIISSVSTTQRDNSFWGINRAQRGVFGKTIEYISQNSNIKESRFQN